MGQAGSNYFDHYLDGKFSEHPKYGLETSASTERPNNPRKSKRTAPQKRRRDAGQLFKVRDTDKDGLLTLEEFIGDPTNRNVRALSRQFNARDRNGDGRLSEDELER